jgi:hypothetical protein
MSFKKHKLILVALLWCGIVSVRAEEVEKDPATGLIKAENWEFVSVNCMACHSTKGFTQMRQDRKNWQKTIKTMQEKNGLWPLGDMESKILDYLEKNYGLPKEARNSKIRRPIE